VIDINKRIAILYVSLLILVLSDVVSTATLLRIGGIETNPITLWQWEHWGFENTVIIKVGLTLFLGLLIWLVGLAAKTEEDKRIANLVLNGVLIACTLFFIFVVANNIYWLIYATTVG
jgi:hypothetical protein